MDSNLSTNICKNVKPSFFFTMNLLFQYAVSTGKLASLFSPIGSEIKGCFKSAVGALEPQQRASITR